ncbi:hypothetical protein E4T47_02455 [Aureobasidium subglaciale]|nr:hypothetical protein E4T47_02455 [Aureobasidium subglaciale]
MAVPNARRAFLDMTRALRNTIKLQFRAWVLQAPANQAAGQRAVTAGTWIGIPPANDVLATGGEGVVHVWCQIDAATNLIIDRVVVKLVVSGWARFDLARTWHGGVGQEPMECHQSNLVWANMAPADRKYILSCLGWGGVDPQTRRYKLYYEYCDHGNLNNLMKIQKPKRKKVGKSKKGRKQFPEPFLWYMFESLAKACVAMEATYTQGLMHGDLHPGNRKCLAGAIGMY